MIKLERVRTKTAIPDVFRGAKRVELNKKLLKAQIAILNDNTKKHEWDSGIWGKSKKQLLKESNGKCAYCEAPLDHIAYGDVEHYRPKSIYWWIAYCYENYLASCTLCNQAFKKDKFPLSGVLWKYSKVKKTTTDTKLAELAPLLNPDPLNEGEGMSYHDFQKAHGDEAAFLLNPYYMDPEMMLTYHADETLKEVEIRIKPSVPNAAKIQTALVDDYGLNRLELKQLRFEQYEFYSIFKLTVKDSGASSSLKQKAKAKIAEMKNADSAFAGMIRYFEAV